MKEETIKRLMTVSIYVGLALVIVAICLAVFGKLHITLGVKGIGIIAATAGTGLVLLLPAKIFLTLLLMKNKDKS